MKHRMILNNGMYVIYDGNISILSPTKIAVEGTLHGKENEIITKGRITIFESHIICHFKMN